MPDLLEETRSSIAKRLRELKPLVDEYQRLEHAAAALAGAGERKVRSAASTVSKRKPGRPRGSASKASAKAPAKPARKATKRRAGRRKGSGTRGAEAAQLVGAQPGITIPELAAKMGIKQTYLYRVMPAVAKEGKVSKRGKGWHPK